MTLYEFNQLTDDEKANFTWQRATHLANRVEDTTHTAALYYHREGRPRSEFFIEVWYNVADNRIDSIGAFRTSRKLLPYFQAVKLEGLE